MEYSNSQMKLDQLIGYFNDGKINLVPPFQRGRVWKLTDRRKLMANMVNGKPIPAIFLYKQESGSKYSYNILDGKQRLESLLLFIGNQRDDLKVPKVLDYFFTPKDRAAVHFWTDLGDKRKVTFEELDDGVVRDFREYAIPTIEITLSDESSLDEIIDLFIDINQQGEPVTRFDIVKATPRRNRASLLSVVKRKRQLARVKPGRDGIGWDGERRDG